MEHNKPNMDAILVSKFEKSFKMRQKNVLQKFNRVIKNAEFGADFESIKKNFKQVYTIRSKTFARSNKRHHDKYSRRAV